MGERFRQPLLGDGVEKYKTDKGKRFWTKFAILCFWLLFWVLACQIVNNGLFLVSPLTVGKTLITLIRQGEFWATIAYSFLRIVLGFLLATLAGILLAILAYRFELFKELIHPLIVAIKAAPVASFIILALLWVDGSSLSILISFLMVVPIIYTNVYQGLMATDRKLLEMAQVFKIKKGKTIRAIYIPSVMPYFISAVTVGLGFCWKAGIAAEVIGIPSGSIGERLYEAKIYLITDELFAWTTVIIVISILFEKAVLYFIQLAGFNTYDSNRDNT